MRSFISKPSQFQLTALQWAIDNGADSVVEWLISQGANVNVSDPEGNTPLHFGV